MDWLKISNFGSELSYCRMWTVSIMNYLKYVPMLTIPFEVLHYILEPLYLNSARFKVLWGAYFNSFSEVSLETNFPVQNPIKTRIYMKNPLSRM
jgi:hypothetical protein